MMVSLLLKFVSKPFKESVLMNCFLNFLKWFATKQPISVILRFYPERDKSLEELMMVPVFPTIEDLYRKEYYQAIDCVKGELSFCEKHRKNVD